MRRAGLTLALPIILLGTTGTVVAALDRTADPAFIANQQNLAAITPAVLERFVASASDPLPIGGGRRGLRARCSPRGVGELRNPWICTVSYPIGPRIRYRVNVSPTGHVRGASADGVAVVYGCCVGFHPTP